MTIKVLKQMVDVLEYWDVYGGLHQPTEDAIEAGKQAITELESQKQNFCSRCGKRTKDLTHIHTCTPPQD
jgi:hypothetical protein